mmetsp:Transcript_31614/g.51141  ORF Transcript_31614/g.51141 Transcript_31614/m.51141 type:complete len:83 (+) Transcript_31614:1385-1633(+)
MLFAGSACICDLCVHLTVVSQLLELERIFSHVCYYYLIPKAISACTCEISRPNDKRMAAIPPWLPCLFAKDHTGASKARNDP